MGRVKDVLIDREERIFTVIQTYCAGEMSHADLRSQLEGWLFNPQQVADITSAAMILKRTLNP